MIAGATAVQEQSYSPIAPLWVFLFNCNWIRSTNDVGKCHGITTDLKQ